MNHLAKKAQKFFLDSIKINVRGGKGGHGLPQYGGIGGKGGDVYIQGAKKPLTLKSVLKLSSNGLFIAGDGYASRRTRLLGESGRDLIIKVPIGVTIEDTNKQYLGEINDKNDKVIVALGGRGGDKFNDNQGFEGQRRSIKLDLKMISDAVFVGFPNAGKSSLLRAITNATPRVASYPFTTLKPNLGEVNYSDYRKITMADLPGLVEGAHKNLGLGHEFLKHIVRARLLVFLVDINPVDLGPSYSFRSPLEALCILNREIELYDDTLLNKPAILLVSKMDSLKDSYDKFKVLKESLESIQNDPKSAKKFIEESIRPSKFLQFDEVLPISSETGLNIESFKISSRCIIDKYAESSRNDLITSYKELQPSEYNRIIQ